MNVITYGTFDLLHIGHLAMLERLRSLGGHLTVGVSTDAFNRQKGKTAILSYAERARLVGALRCVDRVIGEHSWEQKRDDIQKHAIAIFGIGDDWTGKFDFLKDQCRVIYLSRTPDISTNIIKQRIRPV